MFLTGTYRSPSTLKRIERDLGKPDLKNSAGVAYRVVTRGRHKGANAVFVHEDDGEMTLDWAREFVRLNICAQVFVQKEFSDEEIEAMALALAAMQQVHRP